MKKEVKICPYCGQPTCRENLAEKIFKEIKTESKDSDKEVI